MGKCSPASSKPILTFNLCVDKLSSVVTFHSHAGMDLVFLIVANHHKLPAAAMLWWASLLLFFVLVPNVHVVILHVGFYQALLIFQWGIIALKVNNQHMC